MQLLQNWLQPHSGVNPLFAMRTELLTSSSVDVDACCKQTLTVRALPMSGEACRVKPANQSSLTPKLRPRVIYDHKHFLRDLLSSSHFFISNPLPACMFALMRYYLHFTEHRNVWELSTCLLMLNTKAWVTRNEIQPVILNDTKWVAWQQMGMFTLKILG